MEGIEPSDYFYNDTKHFFFNFPFNTIYNVSFVFKKIGLVVGGIEPPKLLILYWRWKINMKIYTSLSQPYLFSFEGVGLVWNRTRKLVYYIIKKKFENFKNFNNKIIDNLILMRLLHPFKTTITICFANGWNRTTIQIN